MSKRKVEPQQATNGQPTAAHDEVEWITIRVPVFTGHVHTDRPYYVDKLEYRILSADHVAGINRVWKGLRSLGEKDSDRTVHTHADAARWLLTKIAEATK